MIWNVESFGILLSVVESLPGLFWNYLECFGFFSNFMLELFGII